MQVSWLDSTGQDGSELASSSSLLNSCVCVCVRAGTLTVAEALEVSCSLQFVALQYRLIRMTDERTKVRDNKTVRSAEM